MSRRLSLAQGMFGFLHIVARDFLHPIPSHYHKSGDFQDNTAYREFFRAKLRLGIQIVRVFSGSIFRILWQYVESDLIQDKYQTV